MTVIVTMAHIRAVKMCNRESRIFCQRQGWSWQEFLDEGFPAEKLEATGDPMAIRVAAFARQDAARGQ